MGWLDKIKQEGGSVHILGDLFDYWFAGVENRVREVLEALAAPGISIIPGNRDFLIHNRALSGIRVLNEEEIITVPPGRRVLLAHGHTLTRGDYGFKLLHRVGWPALRVLDRVVPVVLKDRLARFLVRTSAVIRPPQAVIPEDIAAARGVDTVICGHLHRMLLTERLIVLPSFFDTGQWLIWGEDGPRIVS